MDQIFISDSEEKTSQIAADLASGLKKGDVVVFNGDLGAGKTAMCRSVIRRLLGQDVNVSSPTFNILQTYDINKNFSVYHYDLYRLKSAEEIFELDIEEAFDQHITLIEWADIILHLLPANTIFIDIKIIDEKTRNIRINQDLISSFTSL